MRSRDLSAWRRAHSGALELVTARARVSCAGAIIEDSCKDADVLAYPRERTRHRGFRRRAWSACEADRPDVIINCAAYTNVDRAEEEPDEGAECQCVRGQGARAGGAGDRGDARALQHGFRVRRPHGPSVRRGGSAESAERVRAVEAARRVVCAGGAARVRVARGEPVRRRDGQELDRSHCAGRGRRPRGKGVSRSGRFAELRGRRRGGDRALLARGEPGLYHCVGTGYAKWYEVAQEIASMMGKERDARFGRFRSPT